jgi:hypothetical protein
MEQPGTSTHLTGAVHDLTWQVVSALRSGDHSGVICGVAAITRDDNLRLAAVRVLGADAMLPSIIFCQRPACEDLAVFEKAILAYPPPPDASAPSLWSHWAMTNTLLRLGTSTGSVPMDAAEPPAAWLNDASWQDLTHQLAVLGGLAVPGTDCGVARAAGRRPVDVARGFVRAVRRRDWLQAAGAGRWLAVLNGVPETLGLDTGLEFVSHMGGADPRVALHVYAAQLLQARGGA